LYDAKARALGGSRTRARDCAVPVPATFVLSSPEVLRTSRLRGFSRGVLSGGIQLVPLLSVEVSLRRPIAFRTATVLAHA